MAKISGKFAPLTDELGNDERFIMQSTDLDKLLYVLIIYTCHMTNHQAPKDPRFYKIRYGLRSKTGQIAESIGRLSAMYPKISWGDKKLSLLNSPTYEIKTRAEGEGEREKEEEKEREGERVPRETNSNPLDPRNILACDLFTKLTPFQKQTIVSQYPREFLANKLSAYVSSAAQKSHFTMNPTTVFEWLERDYRDTQKPRIEQPKTKLEKSREALRDFAETESENVCQRDGDFGGVVPVPGLPRPEESSDDLRPA